MHIILIRSVYCLVGKNYCKIRWRCVESVIDEDYDVAEKYADSYLIKNMFILSSENFILDVVLLWLLPLLVTFKWS